MHYGYKKFDLVNFLINTLGLKVFYIEAYPY